MLPQPALWYRGDSSFHPFHTLIFIIIILDTTTLISQTVIANVSAYNHTIVLSFVKRRELLRPHKVHLPLYQTLRYCTATASHSEGNRSFIFLIDTTRNSMTTVVIIIIFDTSALLCQIWTANVSACNSKTMLNFEPVVCYKNWPDSHSSLSSITKASPENSNNNI